MLTTEELQARNESRVAARKANPELTVFDTGEMLEPSRWGSPDSDKVDFDDDNAMTHFTVFAHPSLRVDEMDVLQIDMQQDLIGLHLTVGDQPIATVTAEGEVHIAESLSIRIAEQAKLDAYRDALKLLDSFTDSHSGEIYHAKNARLGRELSTRCEAAAKNIKEATNA